MAKISRDLATPPGGVLLLHPRENLFATGNLAAVNSEIIAPCDGSGTVMLEVRGTSSMTLEVQGTVNGVDYELIPMRPKRGGIYAITVSGAAPGLYVGDCSGYRSVRVRVTAYTSGACSATLSASMQVLNDSLQGAVTPGIGTTTGAAGAAVTLTLAAPGVGLRHYLTYLSMARCATALLTAAAVPVVCTTTNLPGALAFSRSADALAQGVCDAWREDFAYALASSAQNTATTIVCPATPNVIWRVTAGFYVAP